MEATGVGAGALGGTTSIGVVDASLRGAEDASLDQVDSGSLGADLGIRGCSGATRGATWGGGS